MLTLPVVGWLVKSRVLSLFSWSDDSERELNPCQLKRKALANIIDHLLPVNFAHKSSCTMGGEALYSSPLQSLQTSIIFWTLPHFLKQVRAWTSVCTRYRANSHVKYSVCQFPSFLHTDHFWLSRVHLIELYSMYVQIPISIACPVLFFEKYRAQLANILSSILLTFRM